MRMPLACSITGLVLSPGGGTEASAESGEVVSSTGSPLTCGAAPSGLPMPGTRACPRSRLAHQPSVTMMSCGELGCQALTDVLPGHRRPPGRTSISYVKLIPLCRRHHQAKQAHGWRLDQPRPGVLTWTTPPGAATPSKQPPTPPRSGLLPPLDGRPSPPDQWQSGWLVQIFPVVHPGFWSDRCGRRVGAERLDDQLGEGACD
jgi:hypothetical protein